MAKHKEIEIKWNIPGVSRKIFNDRLGKYLAEAKIAYKVVRAKGDDIYYRIGDNNPLRHRFSGGVHELTAKGRLSMDSITVRVEKNLAFKDEVDPLDVHLTLKLVGFKVDVQIYKDCDIYNVDDNGREVQIVWYKATKDHKTWRYFLEIEIPNLNQRESMRLLKKWRDPIENMFGITQVDVEMNSLYEVYSGRKYKVSNEYSRPFEVRP